MLTPPLRPMVLAVDAGALSGSRAQSGQALQAAVRGLPGETFLQLGTTRVALPAQGGLTPGTLVRVEFVENPQSTQIRVTPIPPAPPGPAPLDTLAGLLRGLDALPLAREVASLIPASLPRTEDMVGPLLRVLLARNSLTDDLARLADLLTQAQRAGAVPAALHDLFMGLWGQVIAQDAEGIAALLKRLAREYGGEARLARAIKTGQMSLLSDESDTDLRTVLASLAKSSSLRAFLGQSKQLADFDEALARILDRLSGAQRQNLHGRSEPYLFIDVPFPPDSGMHRAQVHCWSNTGKQADKDAQSSRQVAFDLETAHLGALWITLNTSDQQCACHLQATNSDVIQVVREHTHELEDALRAAGYERIRLQVSRWDGNRLREVIALARRFTGLNLSG